MSSVKGVDAVVAFVSPLPGGDPVGADGTASFGGMSVFCGGGVDIGPGAATTGFTVCGGTTVGAVTGGFATGGGTTDGGTATTVGGCREDEG